MMTPDTAALVQHELGCREVPTYDLGGSGCAGFVQALDVARARIAVDPKKILVIGVELISRMISQDDRATAILFGDGAGAMVLGPDGGKATVLDVVTGTDGRYAGILTLGAGGTRQPFNETSLSTGDYNRLIMDGRRVFTEAVRRMSEAATTVIERIGKLTEDVALVIPHQANIRIIDAICKRTGIALDKCHNVIETTGNTSAATIPLCMERAFRAGALQPGAIVVMTGFGAGMTWATTVTRW
jgi:3-oxoacyl-[acyl-carrier-protein] synthase-3